MNLSAGKRIEWDIGTAYDFFISLWVLQEPEHVGLRGSWAAGVRSRLPGPEREILQRVTPLVWPLPWVYTLPAPKDAMTALKALGALSGAERLLALTPHAPEPVERVLRMVGARGSWDEAEQNQLVEVMQEGDWGKHPTAAVRKKAAEFLDLWTDPAGTAEGILSAYKCYHEEFFAEEEKRIRPALKAALARGREVAETAAGWEALLEELSQGVRIAKDWESKTLILAPSYWGTPLALMADFEPDQMIFLFGARPADESLIPGEVVPDALYQALKALADPTRLRILRYLTDEPLTPAELARRLRLRAPTVIHHLDALRLARLVIVTLDAEGKRYTVRPDATTSVCEILNRFLVGREE
jgi:DNA-binding transcriptional ArsR family regulator